MSAKHTKEPWEMDGKRVITDYPCECDGYANVPEEEMIANLARAVACVNACAPGGPVAKLAEAAHTVLRHHVGTLTPHMVALCNALADVQPLVEAKP